MDKIKLKKNISLLLVMFFMHVVMYASHQEQEYLQCADKNTCPKILSLSLVDGLNKSNENLIDTNTIKITNLSRKHVSTRLMTTYNGEKKLCSGQYSIPAKGSIVVSLSCNVRGIPYLIADSDGRSNELLINQPQYSVNILVSSLKNSMTFQDTVSGDQISPSSSGTYTITQAASGKSYNIIIASQPAGQTCAFTSSNTGIIGTTDVSTSVTCTDIQYSISGDVSISSGAVELLNNGASLGSFFNGSGQTFVSGLAYNDTYSITAVSPLGKSCVVTGDSSGTISADVTNVVVTCTDIQYSISGDVSISSGAVELLNNGVSLGLFSNGPGQTFVSNLTYNAPYDITEIDPPGKNCSVTGGGPGTISGDITNVTVTCNVVPQYTITPSAGTNGSISPATAQLVNSGSSLSFTASPDSGFFVNEWLLDGILVQTGGTGYNLNNIQANHNVDVSFQQEPCAGKLINEECRGGIIFKLPAGGNPGLIVSKDDVPNKPWQIQVPSVPGCTFVDLLTGQTNADGYKGKSNTDLLVNACGNTNIYGAGYCRVDLGPAWYLPATTQTLGAPTDPSELNDLYLAASSGSINAANINMSTTYWGSSEANSYPPGNAVTQSFFNGILESHGKGTPYSIRCIQDFNN